MAAMDGHSDIVRYLGDRGANLNIKAENGLTPLAFANQGGHSKVIDYLKSKGAQ